MDGGWALEKRKKNFRLVKILKYLLFLPAISFMSCDKKIENAPTEISQLENTQSVNPETGTYDSIISQVNFENAKIFSQIITENANVRKQPNIFAPVVASLKKAAKVGLFGRTFGKQFIMDGYHYWFLIAGEQSRGWISASVINGVDDKVAEGLPMILDAEFVVSVPGKNTKYNLKTVPQKKLYSGSGLVLGETPCYSQPDEQTDKIGVIPDLTCVEFLGSDNNKTDEEMQEWVKVKIRSTGVEGWIKTLNALPFPAHFYFSGKLDEERPSFFETREEPSNDAKANPEGIEGFPIRDKYVITDAYHDKSTNEDWYKIFNLYEKTDAGWQQAKFFIIDKPHTLKSIVLNDFFNFQISTDINFIDDDLFPDKIISNIGKPEYQILQDLNDGQPGKGTDSLLHNYFFDGFYIQTWHREDRKVYSWNNVLISNNALPLNYGFHIGMAADEVKSILGDPDYMTSDSIQYVLLQYSIGLEAINALTFYIQNDLIVEISNYEPYLTGELDSCPYSMLMDRISPQVKYHFIKKQF